MKPVPIMTGIDGSLEDMQRMKDAVRPKRLSKVSASLPQEKMGSTTTISDLAPKFVSETSIDSSASNVALNADHPARVHFCSEPHHSQAQIMMRCQSDEVALNVINRVLQWNSDSHHQKIRVSPDKQG
jgi:hypothetical protein